MPTCPRWESPHNAGGASHLTDAPSCSEGNQLGYSMPTPLSTQLPYVETRTAMPRPHSGMRTRDAKSFDSRLNVLLPRRIECLRILGLRALESRYTNGANIRTVFPGTLST